MNECDQKYKLQTYHQKSITVGNGKGITSYFKPLKAGEEKCITSDKYQMMKFRYRDIDILNVYRSQSWTTAEFIEDIKLLLDPTKKTIITGDFNICYNDNRSNKIVQYFLSNGFEQLVHEPTHIKGRLIDHVYWLNKTKRYNIDLKRYSPYYSDHDALCICISKKTSRY